jgi:signal transduction histidine kinase
LNLLTNAIKYKCENKTLKIAIESSIVKDKTVLTFSDNGIGIDLKRKIKIKYLAYISDFTIIRIKDLGYIK